MTEHTPAVTSTAARRAATARCGCPSAAGRAGLRRRTGRRRPELVADCVHCGFCLPTCPTYVLWGEEMDSPRGRIYLMNEGLRGRADDATRWSQHFDACLGCMACVTACPSGVQYDKLIEATRAQVERRYDRPRGRPALRERDLRAVPLPAAAAADARAAAALPGAPGCRGCCARSGLLRADLADRSRRWRRSPRRSDARRAGCPSARRRAGPRRGDRRHAHRLRAARVLPRRQRRHGPGARGRGLRRRRARGRRAAAARCRRTTAARRRRSGSPGALIDELRAGRRRRRRGQRGRVRLGDEGVRRPARRRPGVRRARRAFTAKVRDVAEFLAELGPGRRRATRCRSPSPTTTPATSGTPRASAASRASCCAASPGWSCGRSPRPSCAAARPASTTSSTPSPRGSSATARPRNVAAHRRRAAGHRQPRLPDAGGRRPSSAPGSRMALAHTVEVLDASIRGLGVDHLGVDGLAPTRSTPRTTTSTTR